MKNILIKILINFIIYVLYTYKENFLHRRTEQR